MKPIHRLKKYFVIILAVLMMTGCNAQVIDTTLSYERAIINLQDGTVVEGKVESWCDYENSDMIQVKIGNTTYFTHISNVVLISE